MWSKRAKRTSPLTLISKGDNPGNPGEPGNSQIACDRSFTYGKCGRRHPYSDVSYCTLPRWMLAATVTPKLHRLPKTATFTSSHRSNSTAPAAYPNQENLYDYRNGAVQYVTTFTIRALLLHKLQLPDLTDNACSDTPMAGWR